MSISWQLLFEEIHQAKDDNGLRSHLVPKIGEYFAAKRSGIFFFDRILADKNLQKVLKVALSVEHNPVARYLTERHTPVHEGMVTSPKAWAIVCPRPDHWHVMAGPIISHGQLVGAVGCTREKSMPAFNTQNLADLSGICLHLSVWASTVRSQPQSFKTDCLTSRELQIAELVALGQTNAEIGTKLWITENSVKQALKRMFRKLEVSSRAQMVAQLSTTKYHLPKNEKS
ncbi:MAG TPA: helix-turn-helix transcriptional regulator [Cyanobacteria bacterium UBA11149]|nr:helix-turn-helix transcriptional regulator [Cyanobacteria bacterium UBA11367]HBE56146.1 helix-turn-helix transcriptional regulator [Cyanobacteria bacterium UBA11366]HBK65229.1 helix-turn-helix transcriptional regulator [Cyanobacteria bacterium UBA11166]HBR76057.1 helix-turn-helix transcriptional regulator [Cyanobacteria bacterium UBA11159]HBS69235.1 helix-turn-helix transcriptional regulator [Cyanobacteria bacterium UBA11153]HBW88085.1 helix-turn-helix transcriptional regulator [Cyanobacter